MSDKSKSKGIPDNVIQLLADADKRHGFPSGTMASVMQQEIGGQTEKYLGDPSAYHYEKDASGRRVAPQSGKISTAFGPFGILESTGADPGYGVKPLQGKTIDEQVRFASDYLAARSKSAGGLIGGLAGYGEGAKYAAQVAQRVDGPKLNALPAMAKAAPPVSEAPVVMSQAPVAQAPEIQPAPAAQLAQAAEPVTVAQVDPAQLNAWHDFLRTMPKQAPQPVNVADLRYGEVTPAMQLPQFQFNARAPQSLRPNFEAFGSWGARRA